MIWEVIIKWLPRLSEGALLTLELVAIAVVAGLILALPMGIARASKHWYVRALPYGYIFFFRGTPLWYSCFWSTTAWRNSTPCARAHSGPTCARHTGARSSP